MKILVFGTTGQVATELRRQADVLALGREQADLSDPATCAAAIAAHGPDAIINAAAYTAVDKAEEDEAMADVINARAPAAMAQAAAARAIPFVHISTDYVFSGTGTHAWRPEDPVAPLNAYGRTKLGGEVGVRAARGPHAILRTSWVFSAHGNNFLKTMLRLGRDRDALTVVGDQIGGPTPADAIAAACLSIARHLADDPGKTGTYHFSGRPDASWADFAREIMSRARLNCSVSDISTTDYPTPAARPANSRMDCTATEEAFSIPRPDWKAAVVHIIKEFEGSNRTQERAV